MGELVNLYNGTEARVKTWDIWQGFGYSEHRALKKVIFKHKADFEELGELISASTVAGIKQAGRPDESYFLNERQFILLVMFVKNTPESVGLKKRVEKEFFMMRKQLSSVVSMRNTQQWQAARIDGKINYHQKTDVIKKFVEYAIGQGSKSAQLYYQNLAKMENNALFLLEQKFKNVREFLNVRQLQQVAVADQIVEKALQDGMDEEKHYKDIYLMAKDRVIQFSNIIGKSLVIEALENKLLK